MFLPASRGIFCLDPATGVMLQRIREGCEHEAVDLHSAHLSELEYKTGPASYRRPAPDAREGNRKGRERQMTSRERMCKVLNHECPDRLPIFDYAIDKKVVRAICRNGDYADVVDLLDFDAITAWEPSTGGYSDEMQGREPGEEFIDEWGVHRQTTEEMSAYPLEKDAGHKEPVRLAEPLDS